MPELTPAGLGRALAGGRQTADVPNQLFAGTIPVVVPPAALDSAWRSLWMDADSLQLLPPALLLDRMLDMSPDVSRAVWDWLRLCNPGYEYHARAPGSEEDDPRAMAVLAAFEDKLRDLYGSFDVPIGRLFTAAYVRGAFFAELVLDFNGREAVDLATPDPMTVRFRRILDPVRGQTWEAGQWQRGEFDPFDRPTVRYVAVDPLPGVPYGRPLAAPALFASVFLVGLWMDLRRVVRQQGYPRIDVVVKLAELTANMPLDVRDDAEQWRAWVQAAVDEVRGAIGKLQPDDTYVHTDSSQVNRPVGTVDSSSLGAVGDLVSALERWLARALKTMPLLMGLTDGTSEANANRQWEIHAAGVKAIQHHCETLLERLFELALRAQGIQADCEFRFGEIRAAEMLRDEQVRKLRDENDAFEELMGWAAHDEAAEDAVGHPAAVPDPLAIPTTFSTGDSTNPASVQAEPGGNREAPSDPNDRRLWLTFRAVHALDALRTSEGDALRDACADAAWLLTRYGDELQEQGAALSYDLAGRLDQGITEGLRKLPLPGFVPSPLEQAVRLWDESVPEEYRGLLEAEPAEAAARRVELEQERIERAEQTRLLTETAEAVRDAASALPRAADGLEGVAARLAESTEGHRAAVERHAAATERQADALAAPRRTRKLVERDDEGRVAAVTEYEEVQDAESQAQLEGQGRPRAEGDGRGRPGTPPPAANGRHGRR